MGAEQQPAKPTQAPPQSAKGDKPATAPPTKAEKGDRPAEPVPQKPPGGGKFVVQVASYQSKAEADAVRSRLVEAGLQAYVVESVVKEKGTWYRVRVGRHLDAAAAAELAVKAGKGAIVILE